MQSKGYGVLHWKKASLPRRVKIISTIKITCSDDINKIMITEVWAVPYKGKLPVFKIVV